VVEGHRDVPHGSDDDLAVADDRARRDPVDAEDLVQLDQIRGPFFELVCEASVQVGADGFGQGVVGGVR
jgi:hypothetical protein